MKLHRSRLLSTTYMTLAIGGSALLVGAALSGGDAGLAFSGVALAACNPCKPCNPCAAVNPCNPCAAAEACPNPCNPCCPNPCAAATPCAAGNPCNPCNPCAPKE